MPDRNPIPSVITATIIARTFKRSSHSRLGSRSPGFGAILCFMRYAWARHISPPAKPTATATVPSSKNNPCAIPQNCAACERGKGVRSAKRDAMPISASTTGNT